MTMRRVGAIAAGAFAVGILSGTAGTIVGHDAATPRGDLAALMADHMAGYDMSAMLSGSMMGAGSPFGPGMMRGPAASFMPGSQHELHHPATTPDGSK